MDSTGYILLSRVALQARSTQVLANNMANADTPGYRVQQPLFGAFLQRERQSSLPGARDAAYAHDRATWRDTRPGTLQMTGNPLDIAMAPDAYLAVSTPRGERYTRSGRLSLSSDGRLTDIEGNAVLGTNNTPISVSSSDTRLEIMGDGTVRSENGTLGKLRIVRFERPERLQAEGSRLFEESGETARVHDQPGVTQGSFEGSNVSSILEMTRLTTELREFQFAVQFADRENERITTALDRILRRRNA